MFHAYVLLGLGYAFLVTSVIEGLDPQKALAGAALLLVARVFHFLAKRRECLQ
jgi:hypothetical protein